MSNLILNISNEERERLDELARRRGFEESEAYLRALIEADAREHGDTPPFTDDEDDVDIRAEFRQAWRDAMTGNVISLEDLWKAVDDE